MAAHTAERLESMRLFSSNRKCLKCLQLLGLIEYVPRKRTATLFYSSMSKKGIAASFWWITRWTRNAIFIKYACLGSVQSFVLNAHAKKAHINTLLIVCAHKTTSKGTILQIFVRNFCQTLGAQFTTSLARRVKTEEHEVKCDEPLMWLENRQ